MINYTEHNIPTLSIENNLGVGKMSIDALLMRKEEYNFSKKEQNR